jgi:hypothetical protein
MHLAIAFSSVEIPPSRPPALALLWEVVNQLCHPLEQSWPSLIACARRGDDSCARVLSTWSAPELLIRARTSL